METRVARGDDFAVGQAILGGKLGEEGRLP